ncbi:arabinose transporter [Frateuria aurantia]
MKWDVVSREQVATPVADGFEGLLGLLSLTVGLAYLTVGLPLPVISLFVHQQLGMSDVLVGTAVGIQFLATVLTRRHAGAVADRKGPQLALRRGMLALLLAGLIYAVAAWIPGPAWARYLVLIAGRLLVGFGESLMMTGVLTWGVGMAGPGRSGKVMSWVGMAMYGSLAAGAPLGQWLYGGAGFLSVSAGVILAPVLAGLVSLAVPPIAARGGTATMDFMKVVGLIWRPGLTLALQGVGFAAIGAFVSLYFSHQQWPHAGWALTAFGAAFVLARVIFGGLPDRMGGPVIARAFLLIELVGLLLLGLAPALPLALLGAAVTGFGCSLIFPALGVEVVGHVPAESRGTALGAYAAFQDIAYGSTGPLTGLLAMWLGYRSVFVAGAVCAGLGVVMVFHILRRDRAEAAAGV